MVCGEPLGRGHGRVKAVTESRSERDPLRVRKLLAAAHRDLEWQLDRLGLLHAGGAASAADLSLANERIQRARSNIDELERELIDLRGGRVTRVYRIRYPLPRGSIVRVLRRLTLYAQTREAYASRRTEVRGRESEGARPSEQDALVRIGDALARAEGFEEWARQHPDPWLDFLCEEAYGVRVKEAIAERTGAIDPLVLDRATRSRDRRLETLFGMVGYEDEFCPLMRWLRKTQ